jgi:signal transduction histidine kinase
VGLYISKLLVEGMGGKINLDSSIEGVGSVFSFTLPAAS